MVSFRAFAFDALPVGAGIGAGQSTLDPYGPVADEAAALAWLLLTGAAAIFVIVCALAAYALMAPPRRRHWMAGTGLIVGAGIVFPVVALTALLVRAFLPDAAADVGARAATLRIEVIGQQWWWRVRYLNDDGGLDFETANEIRIPVGQPVTLALRSADVIHSFWVPSLAGKVDMIPGRINELQLSADRSGALRGQCAEYCGGAHARMALYVVAEQPQAFEDWRERQRRPAIVATAPLPTGGEALFIDQGCGVCHTVRGTRAAGTLGPDLTHVGGRMSIGAGTLANKPGAIATWVSASQHLKPQNLMPSFESLPPHTLGAIAAYLAGLQ